MVKHVEELRPELVAELLRVNWAILVERQIEVFDRRSPYAVPAGIAERPGGRRHEAGRLEPLVNSARAAVRIASRHQRRILAEVVADDSRIRVSRDVEGGTTGQC